MFHNYFSSQAKSRYLSFLSHSFSFILWSAGHQSPQFCKFSFFFLLLIIIRSALHAEIIIIIIINIIISLPACFSNHGSSMDSDGQQASSNLITQLNFVADLNNAKVRIVLILPLISFRSATFPCI